MDACQPQLLSWVLGSPGASGLEATVSYYHTTLQLNDKARLCSNKKKKNLPVKSWDLMLGVATTNFLKKERK